MGLNGADSPRFDTLAGDSGTGLGTGHPTRHETETGRSAASVFRRAVPWMARWGPLRSRPLLRALRDFLSDMDSSAAAGFGVETAQTSAALSSAGIALPAVEEWIRPVLRRYAATRVGEGPR